MNSSAAEAPAWHIGRMLTAWAVATAQRAHHRAGDGRAAVSLARVRRRAEHARHVRASARHRAAQGFITRTSFSVAGSVLIIAVIDVIGLLV